MTDEKKVILKFLREQASKGGKRTKELHPDHHKKAGRKGLEARWGKKKSRNPQK